MVFDGFDGTDSRHVNTESYTHRNLRKNRNMEFETKKTKKTDKQTNRQTDKQTNRQTNKQTNRQTDKQTDKQTHKEINRKKEKLYLVLVHRC